MEKEEERKARLQGGNFHLKVGGAKSSGNAGDPMLGLQSVVDPGLSLRPHIYNIITQTTRWEVVKNLSFFPFSEHFQSKANFLDAQKGGGACCA